MNVVTLSRELGSQGWEVAQTAAAQLGYRLVRREVIDEAARRAGAPEPALAAIDELGLFDLCPSPRDCRAYHRAVRQVMREWAQAGGVLMVGRAGQVILRDKQEVLHVRIMAPIAVRVERVAARCGIPAAAAAARVEASDRNRRAYLRRFYRARWDDPQLYDLVINTERFSPPVAAGLIVAALNQTPAGPGGSGTWQHEHTISNL